MKKTYISLLSLLLIFLAVTSTHAQVDRQKALNVLLRTNRVINFAHMSVKKGKVYTGNLGKAVRHERYAKKLFLAGQYQRAVFQSKRARHFAGEAIRANRVKPTAEVAITPEEATLGGTSPSDQELDDEVAREQPELKDEDLVANNNLDIDVK